MLRQQTSSACLGNENKEEILKDSPPELHSSRFARFHAHDSRVCCPVVSQWKTGHFFFSFGPEDSTATNGTSTGYLTLIFDLYLIYASVSLIEVSFTGTPNKLHGGFFYDTMTCGNWNWKFAWSFNPKQNKINRLFRNSVNWENNATALTSNSRSEMLN